MIFEMLENSKIVKKFIAMNLWLIWLSWYSFTVLMAFFFGYVLTPLSLFMVKFGLIMGIFLATMATLMTAIVRSSEKTWNDLKEVEGQLDIAEDLNSLTDIELKLGELAKNTTGYDYNLKIQELKKIINLKRKYITK